MGAIFGIGFIIGPMLGGFLGSISQTLPFWFVGCLALLNTVSAYLFLPETIKEKKKEPLVFNPFAPLKRALAGSKLRPSYIAWFLFGVAATGMQSVFSLYLQDVFDFGPTIIGLFMAGMGVVMVLNQGIGLKHFWLKYFSEPKLESDMLLVCGVAFVLLSFHNLAILLIGLLISVLTQSVLRVVMTSQVAGGAEKDEKGEVLGVLSSLSSIGAIIGPFAAGAVFVTHHRLPFIFSAVCMIVAFGVVWHYRRRLGGIKPEENTGADSLV